MQRRGSSNTVFIPSDDLRGLGNRFAEATNQASRRRSWFEFRTALILALFMAVGACAPGALAQVSASISGTVTDATGALVSAATVKVVDIDTGATRTTETDASGRYQVLSLPVGDYEVRVSKDGFSEDVRKGVRLVVAEDAWVNATLQLGHVSQQVTVNGDAPLVSVTTSDLSGLVGQQQITDLPLNGRSFDLLLALNPGIVNFTSEKTGGIGVSNSTVGNNFSVSGNRPQQNLFLLNGIEFTGAAEVNMQPGGTSGELLGVDAVREFNVLRDNYGAEYGKRPGGQVLIVTQSGSNQLHGSVYEYLRNNAFDAPNYFDKSGSAPPFQRNQFGVALGGPIQKDRTFLFGNYEGFRQHLHQTGVDLVPDANARAGFLPCALAPSYPCVGGLADVGVAPGVAPLFSLWPTPGPTSPDLGGIAEVFNSPLQTIRDDFGTTRLDHLFSDDDTLSAVYTIDDSNDVTPTSSNIYSTDLESLREQVFSLSETHVFSPGLLNTARFGYSRAGYYFTGEPTPGTPAASVPGFVGGHPVGAVVVGGSAAANPSAQVGLAGSNIGSNLPMARNLFTYEDSVDWTKGRHQLSFGVWLQRLRSNEDVALSQFGQATFTGLQQMLQGTVGNFLYDPTPTEMNWRMWMGAWYVQDVIRVNSRLTLSLGFRDSFTNGWNEANGRAATFVFNNGVIQTNPRISNSAFTVNNAKFLPAPRLGLAWRPLGTNTVVRAGFGMYYDLQDALGYRMDQNAPFNPSYGLANLPVSDLPLPVSPVPGNAKVLPAGVQPDMKTPTLLSYSLTVEQELSPNTAISVGYVGSHGYHEMLSLDDNEPTPVICPASPCPAVYPGTFPAPLAGSPVPAGSYYIPSGTPVANPALGAAWAWFSVGDSSYNALQLNVTHRFSGGLSLRGVYTWSKALDNGDSLNQTAAGNAPGLVSNPFNLRSDWGPATYDVRNAAVISGTYELPIGQGKPFLNGLGGIANGFVGGWTVNSIVMLQSGFPFTPQLSYNPSNNGDTKNPVRPFKNPNFSGPVILGNPSQWFNPAAFLAPPTGSGFYGNVGRDAYTGPGLATWDFSVLKNIPVNERFRLQFRAELFNMLNRANFSTPNLVVFTPSGLSPTAGKVTSTSTTSRQVQFALKLLW
ncbi:MAG TPA: carboxypeptidase regulatory-like domain-containing protein [Candidatus Dormibacteraeota bacterium]|nr:carboxypeptidase regulatory-like domain-containing protein [Candidatus Dormibacteraeota bacterium]